MTIADVAGPAGALRVDDGGAGGLPVVLVHSFGGNTTHWAAQLRHLRKTRRAVALDLRGHGLSGPPANGDYRIDSMAGDIDAVVNRIGAQKFILVGHSMGGSVAIAYAGLHPERLAGLVLVDTGTPREVPEEQKQQIIKAMESDAYTAVTERYWAHLLSGSGPEVQERIMQDMRNMPKRVTVSIIKELFQYDPLPALSRYHGPKLSIVTPANDTHNSLHRLQPDIPHIVVNGTGHWLHLDRPEEFNRIVDDFLHRVDRNR